MAQNPVRGQYLLVGTDLIKAGISKDVFIRENVGTAIASFDPATERWISGGAVTAACAKAAEDGHQFLMSAIPVAVLAPYLKQVWRAKVRTTRDMILHMLPSEMDPDKAIEFADAEMAALNASYGVNAVQKTA